MATGQQVWESPHNTRSLTRLASRSGGTAAAGDVGGRIVLWDLATGREWGEDHGHPAGLLQLRFTPDSRRVITEGRRTSA